MSNRGRGRVGYQVRAVVFLVGVAVAVAGVTSVMVYASSGPQPNLGSDRSSPWSAAPLWSSGERTQPAESTATVNSGADSGSTADQSATATPRQPRSSPIDAPAAPPGSGVPSTTTEPVATFAPISIEAEGPGTVLNGGAGVVACTPCSGGSRVRYIAGQSNVVVSVNLPSAGSRSIRVTYETDGLRQLKIRSNGVDIDVRWLDGTGWEVPYAFQFAQWLPAGPVQLMFYNDMNPAPDLDRVVIS